MNARIQPSRARGTMAAPPSKSMGHRLLICAGLAPGESVVHGIAPSEDMLATMDCLRALGAAIDYDGADAHVRGAAVTAAGECLLPCRECGSTLRFFVPLALLSASEKRLCGSETLLRRPMGVYEDICAAQGIAYARSAREITVRGALRAGTFRVRGDVSSQFISGLCFALPLLEGDSEIVLTPPVESRPYIDMTLQALAAFGVQVRWRGESALAIAGGQHYAAREIAVEGDYSNAAFFAALNCLGGAVTLTGLQAESLQGDRAYETLFPALCAGGAEIDLSNCPDLGPVCMALAAAKDGAHFTGTRRLRIKESDRCAAMAAELAKFGVRCAVGEDEMTVFPGKFHAPEETLCGHNDHRIVMALSILCTRTGGSIAGAEAVNKSLPDFFERLKALHIEVETNGMD